MTDELFPIVDEQCTVVGKATRTECHGGTMLLHPVVHLHVTTPDKKHLLLQLRSATKKIQPEKWDTAVGGHVDYGETIAAALLRESSEELGIDATQARLVHKYAFQSPVERELVHVYHLEMPLDTTLQASPDEVAEVRFWRVTEIAASLGKGVFTPNFESEFTDIVLPEIINAR